MAELIFGIHCHQPVGNFEDVIVRAFKMAYRPFIESVVSCKDFKFSIHFSGILLNWLKEREKKLFDTIGMLVNDGRCEIVVSGFYEPILASIPKDDRIEQILLSKEWVKREWGVEAIGLWLTERFWDSSILIDLVKCGIEFVLVDDYHLLSAGVEKKRIKNYFVTEKEGFKIKVFPISEKLRYLIPFRRVNELVDFLNSTDGVLTFFDDGEKFGIWPSTYKWVYQEGWLEELIKAIDEGLIRTVAFGDVLNRPPEGLCYLQTTSYFEMNEWTLPPEESFKFYRFVKDLREQGLFEDYRAFLKGGIWYNFFVKYEESNRMHKKMLMISKSLREIGVGFPYKDFLFRAQCNDAYWHGVFGGIYLPHLRRAVFENLLKAENALHDTVTYEDIDCDGKKEIYLRKDDFVIWVYPESGGKLKELSIRKWSFNLADCITRKPEGYHYMKASSEREDINRVLSIHEMTKELLEKPEYDDYTRGAFLERVFYPDRVVPLAEKLYDVVDYSLDGVFLRCCHSDLIVEKRYMIEGSKLISSYFITSNDYVIPEVELNINPGTDQASFHVFGYVFPVSKRFDLSDVKEIAIISPFFKGRLCIGLTMPAKMFVVPIFTLSQSEKGFEKVYQNSAFIFKFEQPSKMFEFSVILEAKDA